MDSVRCCTAGRILRSFGNCFDCRRSRRRRIFRKDLHDCCRSNDVQGPDSRLHRMTSNSVAAGTVPIQFVAVLELVTVSVLLRPFRNAPNMSVRRQNYYRSRRNLHNRIDDNDSPLCRSTNAPRNFDNFQLQLPYGMCLWLMRDEII